MANELMRALARHEGYCCTYALFAANRKTRTSAFAARYGVTRQAILYWRKKLKHQQLACEGAQRCLIEALGKSQARASGLYP